jgi:carbon storage regulator
MLVLSRKKNEVVFIGDHIRIAVVEIRGGKVRLGFDAPKHVPVHRAEVKAALDEQGRRFCAPKGGAEDKDE